MVKRTDTHWVLVVVVVGSGIGTIAAAGAANATPTAELTVLTLVAEELRRYRRRCRPCRFTHLNGGCRDRCRRKRGYGKNAIQYFFIITSLH